MKGSLSSICERNVWLLVLSGVVYYLIGRIDPRAFSQKLTLFDAFYFALVTQSTVGYGDISPKTEIARTLVVIHITTSLYLNIIRPLERYSPA